MTIIFRQLFDTDSNTYTYLLADQRYGSAILIDPVQPKVPEYLQLLRELELKLVMAVDTHRRTDHESGAPRLSETTHCMYARGRQSRVQAATRRFGDKDALMVGQLVLRAPHTPGHTEDSSLGRRQLVGNSVSNYKTPKEKRHVD